MRACLKVKEPDVKGKISLVEEGKAREQSHREEITRLLSNNDPQEYICSTCDEEERSYVVVGAGE